MTKEEKAKEEVKKIVRNHWFYVICICVVILFLGFQIYNVHPDALFIQDEYKDMDDTVPVTAIGAKEINSYQISAKDHTLTGIQIQFVDTG